MSFSKRFRRFYMGLLTLIPGPSKGWFIPYRYASTVTSPHLYSALEPVFKSAERDFRVFLDEIDSYRADFAAIGIDPPPQPRWEQGWFPRLDAAAAYTMVRKNRPNRIVEIGSGHSTRFFARAVQVTSTLIARATLPTCSISSASFPNALSDLADMAIFAPSRAKASAISRPIAPVAPVTQATLSFNPISILCSSNFLNFFCASHLFGGGGISCQILE